jgi:hypothetical protein
MRPSVVRWPQGWPKVDDLGVRAGLNHQPLCAPATKKAPQGLGGAGSALHSKRELSVITVLPQAPSGRLGGSPYDDHLRLADQGVVRFDTFQRALPKSGRPSEAYFAGLCRKSRHSPNREITCPHEGRLQIGGAKSSKFSLISSPCTVIEQRMALLHRSHVVDFGMSPFE